MLLIVSQRKINLSEITKPKPVAGPVLHGWQNYPGGNTWYNI